MYNLTREQIINWLVDRYGYSKSDFEGQTAGELSAVHLVTDRDVIACAEYNHIRELQA